MLLAGYQYHLTLNRKPKAPLADIHFVYSDADPPHVSSCNGSVLIVPEGADRPLEPYYLTDLI